MNASVGAPTDAAASGMAAAVAITGTLHAAPRTIVRRLIRLAAAADGPPSGALGP
ncbi:MAG: hypothetical protein LBE60_14605 [Microbacterium sp.]|uniref:hypothetical protein n=1 Tax=Microbacterium sp. TaxID=51671 RepID=UPI00283680CE|nr:hypothetical protein [Microbacterium sp.]MDR2322864.1 hypothetical protein [Microbacterium sp.]